MTGVLKLRNDDPVYVNYQGVEVNLIDVIVTARDRDIKAVEQGTGRKTHERGLKMFVNGATLKEVGKLWGVVPERARQILVKLIHGSVHGRVKSVLSLPAPKTAKAKPDSNMITFRWEKG